VSPIAPSFRRIAFVAVATGAALLVSGSVGMAATSGPSVTPETWSGRSYVAIATANPHACGTSNLRCDHTRFDVKVPTSYWKTHVGGVQVSISWADPNDNFDLFVYAHGKLVGKSTARHARVEQVLIRSARGSYSALVLPRRVTTSGYNGAITLSSHVPAISNPGTQSGGGFNFGQPNAPLFHYNGPYYFKPPFTVGHSGGGGTSTVPTPTTSPLPGSAGSGTGSSVLPSVPSGSTVRLAPISSGPGRPVATLWAVIPVGLVLLGAVAFVVFDAGEAEPVAEGEERPRVSASDAPRGPIVTMGFAARRAAASVGRGARRVLHRTD
jgi:hypothetical protein